MRRQTIRLKTSRLPAIKLPYLLAFLTLFLTLFSSCAFSWSLSWLFSVPITAPIGSTEWIHKEMSSIQSGSSINSSVLRTSLIAYINARRKGVPDHKQLLTVIDYSEPATEKRLWVFDLRRGRTLFNTWVSHGKNSGGVEATSFSNNPGSLKSSIGVFVTEEPYIGKNGYSLRLRGLEQGINDNAYRRAVVIHGAWYVNPATIRRYGQIGRSWGCPAVSPTLSRPLINTIKDDTLLIAYYPDRHWLSHSRFLNT